MYGKTKKMDDNNDFKIQKITLFKEHEWIESSDEEMEWNEMKWRIL